MPNMAARGEKQQQCHHILVLVMITRSRTTAPVAQTGVGFPRKENATTSETPTVAGVLASSWQERAKTAMAMDSSSHDPREETAIGLARRESSRRGIIYISPASNPRSDNDLIGAPSPPCAGVFCVQLMVVQVGVQYVRSSFRPTYA